MAPTEITLSHPTIKRRISTLQIMQGAIVLPLERVNGMSAEDYEEFTLEWVYGYITPRYEQVRAFAGAGDKGRDVVGYYDDGSIDIYQCKHYDNKIAPTTLYPELGKLCHYTFRKSYPIPKKYVIVAPKGCGPEVLDLIKTPSKINQLLIDNWDTYCKAKITKKETIELDGEFKKYVEGFDFSIISDIAPHELIEQHSKTQYHAIRFGGGIKKYREIIPTPDPEIQIREQRYTTMLFEVYTEKLVLGIENATDLQAANANLFDHFKSQRNAFYSAESLDKFSRENFPESDPLPFEELKDEAESVVKTTLALHDERPGYERLLLASQEIKRQNFLSSPLSTEIKNLDKDGLCQHLANEERIKWISK